MKNKISGLGLALMVAVVVIAGIGLRGQKFRTRPKTAFTIRPNMAIDARLRGPSSGKPMKRLSIELDRRPKGDVFLMQFAGKSIYGPTQYKVTYDRQAATLTSEIYTRDSVGKSHWSGTDQYNNVTDEMIHKLAMNDSVSSSLEDEGCPVITSVSSWLRQQRKLRLKTERANKAPATTRLQSSS
jgi:hypothetical protein